MKTAFLLLFIAALVTGLVDSLTGRHLPKWVGIPITVIGVVGFVMLSGVL